MRCFDYEFKNDTVSLEQGLRHVYDGAHPLAFKALQIMLQPDGRFLASRMVIPEPDVRGVLHNVVTKSNLLKIVWSLAAILSKNICNMSLAELRGAVVARFYGRYAADPLW